MIVAHRRRWGRRAELESPLIARELRLPRWRVERQCLRLARAARLARAEGFHPTAGIYVEEGTEKPRVVEHWTLLRADGAALEPSLRQLTRPTCVLVPTSPICPWCGAHRHPEREMMHWPDSLSAEVDCRAKPFDFADDVKALIRAIDWRIVWRDEDFTFDLAALGLRVA